MVTIDKTLLFQIINMVILMLLLNRMLYKPVRQILRDRAAKLQGMRDDVAGFEKQTTLRQQEVDAKMAEASAKARAALDAARDEAQKAGDARLAEIRKEAEALKEKRLAEIASDVDSARKGLDGGLKGFATDMAGKILGRSL
ncbi:MAG: hypothetical protein CSA20_06035 [Deltaproteobacteria bacterium]|nr:MAG: hypothetical protein CSA20_06035 [Deltaproteobacteria bacterium]